MKTKDITKFVKKNKTALLIALGVVVAAVVVWIVVRKTSGKVKKKEIEDMTGQTVSPNVNFRDLSLRLINAFNGAFSMFTDEAEVYAVLECLNNQADWEYLKLEYEETFKSLPVYEQVIHIFAGGFNDVLVGTMRKELSKNELQRCREILESNTPPITPGF